MTASLLSRMASKFSVSQESLATESLSYILSSSIPATAGLKRVISNCGVELDIDFVFRTQVAGDAGEIPDLVGYEKVTDQKRLILEAKFWDSLTENQCFQSFKFLPPDVPSILLFVAPASRMVFLWEKLCINAIGEGFLPEQAQESHTAEEYKAIQLNDTPHILALVSWRLLLSEMGHSCRELDDIKTFYDIEQLKGLCERMDDEAFLPLRSHELGSENGLRFMQYEALLDDIGARLIARGVAEVANGKNRSTGWLPLTIAQQNAYLAFSPDLWSKLRETPIWLRFYGEDWTPSPQLDARIESLCNQMQPSMEVVTESETGALWIPLYLLTHEEKSFVVEYVVDQIERLQQAFSGGEG